MSNYPSTGRDRLRYLRKYPHIYGETWAAFLRPKLVWNERHRGVAWAKWWFGWTNPDAAPTSSSRL